MGFPMSQYFNRPSDDHVMCNELLELEIDHEEAGTRLICTLNKLLRLTTDFMTGTGNRFRIVSVRSVVNRLDEQSQFPAFTGISRFFR